MEAVAATSPLQRVNNLTPKSQWPQFLNYTNLPKYPKVKNNVYCSAKSNTNKQNATEENQLSPEVTQNSRIQKQATPTSNQEISSLTRGLIFDLGPKNSWDSLEIGSPVVKRFLSDEEERWYMWYHGSSCENPNSDSIGLAVSSNGIHWERGKETVNSNSDVGLVMGPSKDWWAFDTFSIRPFEIVIMSSNKVRLSSAVYWLFYTGFCSERIESFDNSKIPKSLPGLAMSQDGRHWARIEGEHHSGALLDVGSNGEWDSLFIASPQVVFHEVGDLRMYYHSFDVQRGHFAVGIARSRDGMKWIKLGKIVGEGAKGSFDECGIVNPRVLRNKKDGNYLMVYEGVGVNGKRSIGMATSCDGLKDWRRVRDSPVFEQSGDGGWDCEGVGMPCLVHIDGEIEEWRLYYRGIGKGGRSGIGLAVSKGSEVNTFERWTGFHL
ncbi:hypothetical protein ACJIZ3_018680 [Penstemon smallii]|uniref:Uncharacterized protein n=1 Tax=Penstemon smallii TaxID=265156 RepID=A0ABD3T0F9_9LAMI